MEDALCETGGVSGDVRGRRVPRDGPARRGYHQSWQAKGATRTFLHHWAWVM